MQDKIKEEKHQTRHAQILVGATIESARVKGHDENCDSVNQLVLKTDKGTFVVTGDYGGYTGLSCDEYYEKITVEALPSVEGSDE